jgi:hypothetical protein
MAVNDAGNIKLPSGQRITLEWQAQRQDSTTEQLYDLLIIAAHLGMHDAADWLNRRIDTQHEDLIDRNRNLCEEIDKLLKSIDTIGHALFRLWSEVRAIERTRQITGHSKTIPYQSLIGDILKQAEDALRDSGGLVQAG